MKTDNGERRTENGKQITFNFQLSTFSSIIQLEMGLHDYSLSEIARIVEEEDAKIIGLTVDPIPETPERIVVSILINKSDCTAIVNSLFRYNYNIINTFSSPDENSDIMDRYLHLMRYLNV